MIYKQQKVDIYLLRYDSVAYAEREKKLLDESRLHVSRVTLIRLLATEVSA